MTRGHFGSAAMAAGIILSAACGGGYGDSGPPPSGRRTVLVTNNDFQPANVSISVGDTILWSWSQGSIDHNIISNGPPNFTDKGTNVLPGNGTDGMDFFDAPQSHQVIFGSAGTYNYFCSIHGGPASGMRGTVTVAP